MENYTVIASSLIAHTEISLIIEADEAEITENIVLTVRIDGDTISASNYGYFQAFQEIRDVLLQKGYGLKCAGAMLNAVQSPMASATDKVYMVTLGKQSALKDLISLYEYIDIDEFSNTNEQNRFFEQWLQSLK
jgi:hypothetical protein